MSTCFAYRRVEVCRRRPADRRHLVHSPVFPTSSSPGGGSAGTGMEGAPYATAGPKWRARGAPIPSTINPGRAEQTRNHARSTVCGSAADGMEAGVGVWLSWSGERRPNPVDGAQNLISVLRTLDPGWQPRDDRHLFYLRIPWGSLTQRCLYELPDQFQVFRVVGPQPAVSHLCLQPQRQTEVRICCFASPSKEAEPSPSSISRQTARPTHETAAREHRGNRVLSRRCHRGNVCDPGALRAAHEHMINEVVLRVLRVAEPLWREHDASMRSLCLTMLTHGRTVPVPCPIRRGIAGNHGRSRRGGTRRAPDRSCWSEALHHCGGCGI